MSQDSPPVCSKLLPIYPTTLRVLTSTTLHGTTCSDKRCADNDSYRQDKEYESEAPSIEQRNSFTVYCTVDYNGNIAKKEEGFYE